MESNVNVLRISLLLHIAFSSLNNCDLHKSHNQISKLAFFSLPLPVSLSLPMYAPVKIYKCTQILKQSVFLLNCYGESFQAELILFSSFHMNKFLSCEKVFFLGNLFIFALFNFVALLPMLTESLEPGFSRLANWFSRIHSFEWSQQNFVYEIFRFNYCLLLNSVLENNFFLIQQ